MKKYNDVIFYYKGGQSRVLAIGANSALMIETYDDYKVTGYWNWSQESSRREIINMSFMDENKPQDGCQTFGGGWRKLSHDGNDKMLIRNVICAANYISILSQSCDSNVLESAEIGLGLVKTIPEFSDLVNEITESSRDIWQNSPDEAIPTPIPNPDIR